MLDPIPNCVKTLKDDSISLEDKYEAMYALRTIPTEEACFALRECYPYLGTSELLKHELMYILGQNRYPSSLDFLIKSLHDETEDPVVRHEAGEALSNFSDYKDMILPELKKHLNSNVSVLKSTVEIAIRKMESFNPNANNYNQYVSQVLKSASKFKSYERIISKIIKKKKTILPDKSSNIKKTLILDLDETLIRSEFSINNNSQSAQNKVEFIDSDTGDLITAGVILRPGVKDFLEAVSAIFEVGVFTAGVKEYADAVIDFLDPENKFFSFRLYRNDCVKIGRAYIKDLRVVDRDLSNVVIVDNSLYSFVNQLSNGILISSFYDDPEDLELMNILKYLMDCMLVCEDVEYVNDQVFKFQDLFERLCD